MFEASRLKNLALVDQLCASREELKRDIATCKSSWYEVQLPLSHTAFSATLEVKTSTAREILNALKECQTCGCDGGSD